MDAPLGARASREELVAAIEENLFALAKHFRRIPGAEAGEGEEGIWTVTPVRFPFFNSIFRTRIEAASAGPAIDRALARAAANGVPFLWWTGPQTRPTDLGRALVARGFTRDAEAPGMALELARLPARPVGPAALAIETVEGEPALGDWLAAFRAGFGIEPEFEPPWRHWLRAVGLTAESPMRHFLAREGGRPVGTVSLHFAAGVVGVYNVATVPEARRRGIAAEATRQALGWAAARRDARWAILHSSTMGVRLYRALGFREHCRIGVYFWMG
jgi:ribosomal protein S18 acetylase RimI-like enzyme